MKKCVARVKGNVSIRSKQFAITTVGYSTPNDTITTVGYLLPMLR